MWHEIVGVIVFDDEKKEKYWENFFYNYEMSLSRSIAGNNLEQQIFFVQGLFFRIWISIFKNN